MLNITGMYSDADELIYGTSSLQFVTVFGVPIATWVGNDDEIFGLGGDDTIFAGGGDDTVHGGEDHDLIYGGTGDDSLYGDNGNDVLDAGDGFDRLLGGDGDDTLYGGGDDADTLFGGRGNDVIYGSDGDDRIGFFQYELDGLQDEDTIHAGGGNDTILAGYTGGEVNGGTGDDSINASIGLEGHLYRLNGEAGNDTILGSASWDIIDAGDDNDVIHLSGDTKDSIEGGAGDDLVIRGEDADWDTDYTGQFIDGGAGYDTLDVSLAAQDIYFEAVLGGLEYGFFGFEHIISGQGDDTLRRSVDFEIAELGKGNDWADISRSDAVTIFGGVGSDTLVVFDDLYPDGVTVNLDPSRLANVVFGNGTATTVREFEIFELTDRADRFDGWDADETVYLGGGRDTAEGGAGNDELHGQNGRDTLNGGLGDDTLFGGDLSDEFRFDIDTAFGHDLIADFEARDQITLETNGAFVGAIQVDVIDADVLITIESQPDASVFVLGAAELLNEENLVISSTFEFTFEGF